MTFVPVRGLLAAALFWPFGCAHTTNRFEPYSATSESSQMVITAVEAHEGDIPALQAARAELVGTISAAGNGYASEESVERAAAHEAALHGGTHYIVGAVSSDTFVYQAPSMAYTTVSGNAAYTTVNHGAPIPVVRYSIAITVVRVPPQNWASLAPALRPIAGKDPPPTKAEKTCVQDRNLPCR